MTYDDLVKNYGTMSKAAKALGLARQTVHRWKDGGIPYEKQVLIQLKTKGRLKARIPEMYRRSQSRHADTV